MKKEKYIEIFKKFESLRGDPKGGIANFEKEYERLHKLARNNRNNIDFMLKPTNTSALIWID